MNRLSVIFVLSLLGTAVSAEDHVDLVRKGNEEFRKQNFSKALEYYHSAETELPASSELEYNIAGALHQQGKYEETVDKYTRALNSPDITVEQRAHYNLGNTYYRTGEFDKAITSYQKALDIDPDDMEAKFNLELARRRLKEQMSQEQPGGEEQQQQPQQEQPEQEQQEQQEQQQQEDQQQQQQEQQEQPQPEEMEQDDKDMSREDAERILNALRDDERELQKQIKRQENKGDYLGKDW